MIYNTTTGLFKSTDKTLHTWSLQNGDFYPCAATISLPSGLHSSQDGSDIVVHRTRGGGGGLFFRLPKAPGAAEAEGAFTHMLQSDFPGKSDGTAFCEIACSIWPRVSSR